MKSTGKGSGEAVSHQGRDPYPDSLRGDLSCKAGKEEWKVRVRQGKSSGRSEKGKERRVEGQGKAGK